MHIIWHFCDTVKYFFEYLIFEEPKSAKSHMLQLSNIAKLAHNWCHVEFWFKQIISSLCLHNGHQLCWCHYLLPGGELAHLHIPILLQFLGCRWSHQKTWWCWIFRTWIKFSQLCLHHDAHRGNSCHPHWICLHYERLQHPHPTERLEEEVRHGLLQGCCEKRDEEMCWRKRWFILVLLKPHWSLIFNYTYLS